MAEELAGPHPLRELTAMQFEQFARGAELMLETALSHAGERRIEAWAVEPPSGDAGGESLSIGERIVAHAVVVSHQPSEVRRSVTMRRSGRPVEPDALAAVCAGPIALRSPRHVLHKPVQQARNRTKWDTDSHGGFRGRAHAQ